MATIAVTATICGGGGHVHASARVNGGAPRTGEWDTDDLRGTPSAEEVEIAVRTMLRLHCMGMTRVQARNALLAGITITTAAT